jgi:FtsH-binding integral membrane protein
VLFGIWKEGDHRDWEAIRAWAESLRPQLIGYILTILVALVIVFWAGWRVQRKHGSLILILLSIFLLLVGGGFFPPLFGIIAGGIGTHLKPG